MNTITTPHGQASKQHRPAIQRAAIAKHIHATTTALPTGHVPMLSKPDEVAAVIIDAASKAGQR